ncbi:hypothetical protein AHAS_Ahas17G0239000 [Arachis hypogaea]
MAPKAGESSSREKIERAPSTVAYKLHRFYSKLHREHYYTVISKKKVISEVKFELKADEYPEIQEQIQIRGWKILANPMTEVRVLKEDTSRSKIGSSLQGHKPPRAHWKKDARGPPFQLRMNDLKPVARGWLEFIQRSILPTSNCSEVTVRRAVMIHCIMLGNEVEAKVQIDRDIFIAMDNPITKKSMEHTRELAQAPISKPIPPLKRKQPKWPQEQSIPPHEYWT